MTKKEAISKAIAICEKELRSDKKNLDFCSDPRNGCYEQIPSWRENAKNSEELVRALKEIETCFTPKKVKAEWVFSDKIPQYLNRLVYLCPNCGDDAGYKADYCPHCGQAIDWTDYEAEEEE